LLFLLLLRFFLFLFFLRLSRFLFLFEQIVIESSQCLILWILCLCLADFCRSLKHRLLRAEGISIVQVDECLILWVVALCLLDHLRGRESSLSLLSCSRCLLFLILLVVGFDGRQSLILLFLLRFGLLRCNWFVLIRLRFRFIRCFRFLVSAEGVIVVQIGESL
ncbi:hypothetical protein PFISCL1PPCAC_24632, partial [Pristionchus fissidentatus]